MNSRVTTELPMFYKELEQLSPERHMGLGLTDRPNFSTARQANAVPLGISEFAFAARDYPIVFGPAGLTGIPVAITALVEAATSSSMTMARGKNQPMCQPSCAAIRSG